MLSPPSPRQTPSSLPAIEHVAVVVPARDEADRIVETIRSVQIARQQIAVACSITVVADRCVDETSEQASAALDPHRDQVVACDHGAVGAARGAGVRAALARTGVPVDHVWLASTDADTIVGPDWLGRQLVHAARDAVGVVGVVGLNSARIDSVPLAQRFAEYYEIPTDGAHPHVHGANMGVHGAAYTEVGGWCLCASGEDHHLWQRLMLIGHVVADSRMVVLTDPRLAGRAPHGFADDLATLVGAA